MRRVREPWKWPLATGLALLVLLIVVVATPRRWLPFGGGSPAVRGISRPKPASPWLTLLPPPEIQIAPVPEDRPERRPPPRTETQRLADPRWWSAAWRVRVAGDLRASAIAPAVTDSLALLRREIGLEDLPPRIASTDSLLARRLALLKLHDAQRFEELKPYFHAAARADLYRDLMSRVNAMYDDFLHSEIMVPD